MTVKTFTMLFRINAALFNFIFIKEKSIMDFTKILSCTTIFNTENTENVKNVS